MKIYVETSVWCFVFADDVPDYRQNTLEFFNLCRTGIHDPFISTIVLKEVANADSEIQQKLLALIKDINPVVIEYSDKAERLSEAFTELGAVPASKPDDARHVAYAFTEELDALVSWNFRHIASVSRSDKFNAIALLEGFYKPLRIASPLEVLYGDEPDTP